MLVRAVRSWCAGSGHVGRPFSSLFSKAGLDGVKVWLPRTHGEIPDDYVASYPKPDETEEIKEEVWEGDPSGIPVMIETQRVIESGAPSLEVPEDRVVRLYAKLGDLKMNERDQENLVAILGPRFDANKGLIKLTSSKYPSPDENTQHCITTLKDLMAAAKDMTKQLGNQSHSATA